MHIGINAQLLAFSENYRQAGLSRYIYEIVTRAPALLPGDRFTAFTGEQPAPQYFRKTKPRNLKLSRSRIPTSRAPVRILWEQTALPVAAARSRLDLLHCPVNVRPLVCSCPTIVTVHDVIFLRYPQAFKPTRRRYLSAMTGWSCRHARHVITVSEATRQDVIKMLGVPAGRVTTVHNGVGEQFRKLPPEQVEAFRREKGLEGKRVILYVGTLEPRKNLPVLIKAFAQLRSQPGFENALLVVGGSKGWYYDEIFSTAERIGLASSGAVSFLGRVPDVELSLWYNTATVFAYPSLYEGFGLPVLEAMACGTPALAANTSAFPEVAGDAALLLDPQDVKAWTEALTQVLKDPQLSGELSSRGLKQASKFSWQKAAEETVAIYRQVLDRDGT